MIFFGNEDKLVQTKTRHYHLANMGVKRSGQLVTLYPFQEKEKCYAIKKAAERGERICLLCSSDFLGEMLADHVNTPKLFDILSHTLSIRWPPCS